MSNEKTLKVLEMIQQDMESDATEFDGKPFDGKTVATYFGNQGAAIAALARIIAQSVITTETPQREIQIRDRKPD